MNQDAFTDVKSTYLKEKLLKRTDRVMVTMPIVQTVMRILLMLLLVWAVVGGLGWMTHILE